MSEATLGDGQAYVIEVEGMLLASLDAERYPGGRASATLVGSMAVDVRDKRGKHTTVRPLVFGDSSAIRQDPALWVSDLRRCYGLVATVVDIADVRERGHNVRVVHLEPLRVCDAAPPAVNLEKQQHLFAANQGDMF